MREVNFSIPNVNKASVGITTALYDRRALDCTSTLPLINSLNHLAYLTTSSARIRDILTVDGGIERLVCILKEGRSKDMLDMWKWNLAFQCIVNIGVRGTEVVRTRVVEADMVPVIATILDNYIQITEKCREKADEAKRKDPHRHRSHDGTRVSKSASSFSSRAGRMDVDQRSFRRQAPPPSIDVLATLPAAAAASNVSNTSNALAPPSSETTPASSQPPVSSPPGRYWSMAYQRWVPINTPPQHTPHNSRPLASPPSSTRSSAQPLASAGSTVESPDAYVRPVRDTDRLASMTPFGPGGAGNSQPTSPTTPLPPTSLRSPTVRPSSMLAPSARSRRRPSIRHQHSTAADHDDLNADSMQSDDAPDADMSVADDEIQPGVGIQDVTMEDDDGLLTGASLTLTVPTASEVHETDTFNITHRVPVAVDGSIAAPNTPATVANMGLSPNRPAIAAQPVPPQPNMPRYLSDRLNRLDRHVTPNPSSFAAMPRDEDVMMSLQLLAYVSKYCNLRTYFQKSHLVPRLRIGKELRLLDGADLVALETEMEEDERKETEEYLLPNDLNIFPLVEKFTMRNHSTDLQYWAGVVMRNLCRKDESHGGVRQCAYYECNKWEEWPRQFAKCRRCRRTKYCSKECQKNAWIFHRHWCVATSSSQ